MASHNEKVPIPLPVMGVRKDVSDFSLEPNALAQGVNVIAHQGVLKPRPAHEQMPWQSIEGWRVHFARELGTEITSIVYDGTRWMYTTANGKIGYTTDFFATTPVEYNCPSGVGLHIFYHSTIFRYCLGTSTGRIYCPAIGVIPMSTIAWGGPVAMTEVDGEPGATLYGMVKDSATENMLAVLFWEDTFLGYVIDMRYSEDGGHTWTDLNGVTGFQKCEMGYGGESGAESFLIRLADYKPAPLSINYDLYSIKCSKVSAEDPPWIKEASSAQFYSSFVGDDSQTLAVWRSDSSSKIVRSTNLGSTWSDEIDGSGDPDAFHRVFYQEQGAQVEITGWELTFDPEDYPNIYNVDPIDEPTALYVDGVLADRVFRLADLDADHKWLWAPTSGGILYLYCSHGVPDEEHTVTTSATGSALSYLAVGSMCYQSDDGDQWVQYANPPFIPSTITTAYSYDGHWYVFAAGGIWRTPLVELSGMAVPQSVTQFDTNAVEDQIVMATQKGWLKLNSSTGEWTDITGVYAEAPPAEYPEQGPLTGASRKSRTVFRPFINAGDVTVRWLVGTNGADIPKVWNSALSTYRDVRGDGRPSYAKAMCIAANRVVFGNGPQGSPYGICCSDTLNFDSYDNLGATLLADTQGAITAMLELSPLQFTVFKEDAIYHGISQVEFQGIAMPFRYELVKSGIIGPPAPHCLVQTHKGEQLYMGHDGGIYLYDGTAPQDIGKHVRHLIEGQLDFDNIEDSWGMVDNIKRIAYFFFPTTGGRMNRGVAIDLDNGAAWEIRLPAPWNAACGRPMFVTTGITWDEVTLAWDDMNVSWDSLAVSDFRTFMALESDVWYRQRWDAITDYTDGGWPINVVWRPGWTLLSDPDRFATLLEIKHLMVELYPGQEFVCTALGMDDEMVTDTQVWARGAMNLGGEGALVGSTNLPNEYASEDTLTTESEGYTTEFMLSAQRFTYEMRSAITKRFGWAGALARFFVRGLR